MRQQKIVAIILTLTLVAALLVTPALAAESAADGFCPSCKRYYAGYVNRTVAVSYERTSCGYSDLLESEYGYIYCGRSGMVMGKDIVHEIM